MIAVSACLAGRRCRYDGGDNTDEALAAMARRGEALCVCPECLGGMETPRAPSEIVGGDGADVLAGRARVLQKDGTDVSEAFVRGAYAALAALQERGIARAVLKARSPSCGAGRIYDGTFSGTLRAGDGVCAALCRQNGIAVETR